MSTDEGRDVFDRGEHGEHGARPFRRATGHQRPATLGEHGERAVVDPPARAQGGQLAEAMPADQIGSDSEILQDLEQPEADGSDRRLGESGLPESGLARLTPRIIES